MADATSVLSQPLVAVAVVVAVAVAVAVVPIATAIETAVGAHSKAHVWLRTTSEI